MLKYVTLASPTPQTLPRIFVLFQHAVKRYGINVPTHFQLFSRTKGIAACNFNTRSRAYLHPLRWHASVKHTVEDLLQVCGHDHQTLDTFLQLSQLLADQVQQQVVALNLKI